MKTIFQAIKAVMEELDPISKERKNTQQGYMFRGVDDAMNTMNPLFAKHGIFPAIHDAQDIHFSEIESKAGAKGYHIIRRYTIRFYSEDFSFVEVKSDGEAIDYGDKASNKAMSVAYREAIFKTFVVPFGDDDIENTSHDLAKTAVQPSTGGLGNCMDCGAPKKMSQKTGKAYCSALCWTKPKQGRQVSDVEQAFSASLDDIPAVDINDIR